MFELIMIWAVSLIGLGVGLVLMAMLARYALTGLGRFVFFADKGTKNTLSANAA